MTFFPENLPNPDRYDVMLKGAEGGLLADLVWSTNLDRMGVLNAVEELLALRETNLEVYGGSVVVEPSKTVWPGARKGSSADSRTGRVVDISDHRGD